MSGAVALAAWYPELRAAHLTCAALSFGLFALRGAWMMGWPHRLGARWVRIVPHIVDTGLLASAIALTLAIRQYPLVEGWLTAKVLALCLYIALGSIALKHGSTRAIRAAAFVAALAVFAYIVGVARMRHPGSWALGL